MTQRESALSRKIMLALQGRGAFSFKVHGSEYMLAGLPDIICCYKGRFIGFETKLPSARNNVSPKQAYVHALIDKADGLCFVICGVDEALAVLALIDEQVPMTP